MIAKWVIWMAIYRPVHVTFWQDPKVIEEMTPEDKLFFLYLITNPKTTQIGIYQITKKQMAFELGYSIESINALMDRFENHHKTIIYNKETRELAIINWGRYNFPRAGTPIENCVKKELASVKDKSLIKIVGERIENKKIKEIFISFLEDVRDELRDGERDEGNNNNKHNNNNNNNNKHNNKKVSLVNVVEEINKRFSLEDEDIKKVANVYLATGRDIEYLIEKLDLVNNTPNVKNIVGYLLKAIQEDYKPIIDKNKNSIPGVKTRFHNINQHFDKYGSDELEQMLIESQIGKFK
ncbi:hypothetical protein [Paraclostridium sordellii]|uniref:hypothetical protein n=1 Tax=Paraclostridium sordellii TaxID=1505 RepID=UPI0005E544EF|nr:hypothetical protein [Paeniclostridium sordellii]CEN87369.1 phage protein [[Clostridium] sordellii] [Paeniclostridium sordellii]